LGVEGGLDGTEPVGAARSVKYRNNSPFGGLGQGNGGNTAHLHYVQNPGRETLSR